MTCFFFRFCSFICIRELNADMTLHLFVLPSIFISSSFRQDRTCTWIESNSTPHHLSEFDILSRDQQCEVREEEKWKLGYSTKSSKKKKKPITGDGDVVWGMTHGEHWEVIWSREAGTWVRKRGERWQENMKGKERCMDMKDRAYVTAHLQNAWRLWTANSLFTSLMRVSLAVYN